MKTVLVSMFLSLLVNLAVSEKQIKLEDIERDTLKAAQQAKYEKQQQGQQYSQQQYSQPQYSQQQAYSQYQQQPSYDNSQQVYQQYTLPQQYLQQLYSGSYSPLTSNSLGSGYTQAVHPFMAYYNQALQTRQGAGQAQNTPIVMAISAPALAAFQQAYAYPGLQYTTAAQPAAAAATPQFVYAAQPTAAQPQYVYSSQAAAPQAAAAQAAGPVFYYTPSTSQSAYVPPFSPIPSSKLSPSAAYPSQYLQSTAPQTFTQQTTYSDIYQPASNYQGASQYQTASQYQQPSQYQQTSQYQQPNYYQPASNYQQASYQTATAQPQTFVSIKAPANLVATQNQQQQYISGSTISPLQTKYLNSPQYLAQNYNTIPVSQLSKSAYSSGIKSTASPPVKATPSNFFPSPSVSNYQPYRNVAGK